MNQQFYFNVLAESLPDMVWGFNHNYELQVANTAFLDMRRNLYGHHLAIGDSLFTGVAPDAVERWKPLYDRGLKGERIIIDDVRLINGREVDVRLSLNPVYDNNNKIIGCMGITFDITHEIDIEKELELLQQHTQKLKYIHAHQIAPSFEKIASLIAQFETVSSYGKEEQSMLLFMLQQELNMLTQQFQSFNKLAQDF